MNVTQFNELMARPNQVKARNGFPCKLDQEQLKAKYIANNINFIYSQTNDAGIQMMSFNA